MMFQDQIDIVVNRILEKYSPQAIIVFGSVSKGTSTEESDLDIAVIMDSDLSQHDRNVEVRLSIGFIDVPMDLLVFTPQEVESSIDNKYSIISEIMKTGEVVYGST